MSASQRKLAWVQALRGIAALMVVLVHSRSVLPDTVAGRVIANNVLLPMGMGVDLFFILSGFLMVLTTRDFDGTPAYAWRFAIKRIARIWPLFAVMTLVAAAVDHHGIHAFLDRSIWLPYLEGLAFIPHNPAASGIYFQMAVGVAWTLCFECYFYLVFAACMLFGRWRYGVMAVWLAMTLIAIPLVRGNYNLNVAAQPLVTWSRYANLAINPIVWDFIAGMFGGWLYGSSFAIRRQAMVYAAVAALLLLLLVAWHRMGMVDFFGPHGWAAPLIIVFLGMLMLAKMGALKVPAWSVWLGDISYSLYLVHVYVFELLQRAAATIPIEHDSFNGLLFVIRPVVAVLCAWATFRYIEAPLSTWTRKRLLCIRVPSVPREKVVMTNVGD